MEIAPGIRRIGDGLVNVYLLEEAGAVTIIDAGAPGYWKDPPDELAAMGRSLEDVRALLLTHAHSDHVGFAERIPSGALRPRTRPPGRGDAGARRDEAGPGSDGVLARLVLPGHGDAWSGGLEEALRLVRESVPAGLQGVASQS